MLPAICTPTIAAAGRYEVAAIFRRGSNRTPDAPYTITHADGTTVVHVSQQGSGLGEEILGTFRFEAGTSGSVRLDNNGGSGAYIADAVIFRAPSDKYPAISSIAHSPANPKPADIVTATATVTDDDGLSEVLLNWSVSPGGGSGSARLFDDGAHGDGAAGDSVFGAFIPAQPDGSTVTYFIAATDSALQTATSPSNSYIVTLLGAPPKWRCVWIDSWNTGFLTSSQADTLLSTCRNSNINTVIPEIRKVGDAYYNSHIEPRATNISSTYDALGTLLQKAHDTTGGKKRVQVHGWFVMHRIATSLTFPSQHVLSLHPEYVMSDSEGNTSSGNTTFLDPGHPGTVDHNVSVIVDCLQNYDLDGVNLDYIRYPEAAGDWGYNPVSVARFNAVYGKTGTPTSSDRDWNNWRRECVTLEVKKVYVKSLMVNPNVVLSVCTVNWGYNYGNFTASDAYAAVYQDWVGWLQKGVVDYNMIMNYATDSARFQGWTNLSLASDNLRGSIIGVGNYLQASIADSMSQLSWALNQGADGVSIYDWGSEVSGSASGETRTQFYDALRTQVFTEWVDPPAPVWKASPTKGIFEGVVTDGGSAVDHATVMIDGFPATATVSDGSGWYGILEVPPGAHVLKFSKAGRPDVRLVAPPLAAGQIITINADFALPPGAGWIAR